MGQHDLSYRLFFSHARMVCDLLREMVGESDRITKADSALLLGWLDRFATATRLADVFDN
ncbi:MAG TPA: hypothetical protein VGK45_12745 [Thermoanaerobaculia bacterium]